MLIISCFRHIFISTKPDSGTMSTSSLAKYCLLSEPCEGIFSHYLLMNNDGSCNYSDGDSQAEENVWTGTFKIIKDTCVFHYTDHLTVPNSKAKVDIKICCKFVSTYRSIAFNANNTNLFISNKTLIFDKSPSPSHKQFHTFYNVTSFYSPEYENLLHYTDDLTWNLLDINNTQCVKDSIRAGLDKKQLEYEIIYLSLKKLLDQKLFDKEKYDTKEKMMQNINEIEQFILNHDITFFSAIYVFKSYDDYTNAQKCCK